MPACCAALPVVRSSVRLIAGGINRVGLRRLGLKHRRLALPRLQDHHITQPIHVQTHRQGRDGCAVECRTDAETR